MAETLAYTDIITPEDIRVDAYQSLQINVTDPNTIQGLGASYRDLAIRACQDVTSEIEAYLDRKLIVRKHTIRVPKYKWEYQEHYEDYVHLPRHWPIVQIETSDVTAGNYNIRLLAATQKKEVEYYAGYRRPDETLDVLKGAAGSFNYQQGDLTGLDTLPELLPKAIKRVAFRLVMYELTQAKQNSFATSSQTQVIGNTQTQMITETRRDYYENELSKLDNFKYL